MEEILSRMDECAGAQDYEGWEVPHRAFHTVLVAEAGERLTGMFYQLYDHAKRYRRTFMLETSRAWEKSMTEHRDIFEVCKERNSVAVAERLARHYSVTALSLMAAMVPEHEPLAVRTALRMAQPSS